MKNNNLAYTASLEFYPLNALTDDGEYRCTVSVSSDEMDEKNYTTSISSNASTSLDVLGKLTMGLLYQQLLILNTLNYEYISHRLIIYFFMLHSTV